MSEIERIRAQYRPDRQISLRVLDVWLTVHTNDARIVVGLSQYFSPYVAERPPANAPAVFVLQGAPMYDPTRLRDVPRSAVTKAVKEAYYDSGDVRVVIKRRTGVVIYVAEPDHYVVGDMAVHLHQASNVISMVFAKTMSHRGYVMLHASAALNAAGGVAFVAPSGTGKSTMALAVVERGYRFVTNDRLLVRPLNGRVEMVGVPKRPRVNPGTLMRLSRLAPVASPSDLRRYRRLSPDELWTVEEKWDVDVDAIFGQGTFQLAGWLDAVYMLRWHPRDGAGWQVRPLEPAERKTSLAGMAKTVGVYDLHPPAPTEQQMLLDTIADTIPIYEVTGRVDVMALRSYLLEHPAHTPAVS